MGIRKALEVYMGMKRMSAEDFRKEHEKKGYGIVDITQLCEVRMGNSGWCHGLNEPIQNIHHIQILYRGDVIANVQANGIHIIDEDQYCLYVYDDEDFALFLRYKLK